MITRLKSSSVAQGLPKYRSLLAGNDTYYPSVFESIATVSVAAGNTSSTLSFTSIPGTYTHLQIRGIGRTNRSTPADMDSLALQFNSDTSSNYADHRLAGNGSSAGATNDTSATTMSFFRLANTYVASTYMGAQVIDVLDYANTNKYKTVRALGGVDNNGSGQVALNSGLWRNTSAITSITLKPDVGSAFTEYTKFALYGIKSSY